MAEAKDDPSKQLQISNKYGNLLNEHVTNALSLKSSGKSGYAADEDQELMNLAVDIASNGSNSAIKSSGGDTEEARIKNRINAFRGSTAAGAQSAMNTLLREKVDKSGMMDQFTDLPQMPTHDEQGNELNRTQRLNSLTGDQLGDIATQVGNVTQSNPEVMEVLQKYKEQSFNGIDASEQEKSSAVINNFTNRVYGLGGTNKKRANVSEEEMTRNSMLMKLRIREENGKLKGGQKSQDALNILMKKEKP